MEPIKSINIYQRLVETAPKERKKIFQSLSDGARALLLQQLEKPDTQFEGKVVEEIRAKILKHPRSYLQLFLEHFHGEGHIRASDLERKFMQVADSREDRGFTSLESIIKVLANRSKLEIPPDAKDLRVCGVGIQESKCVVIGLLDGEEKRYDLKFPLSESVNIQDLDLVSFTKNIMNRPPEELRLDFARKIILHLGGTSIPRSAAELALSEETYKEMDLNSYFFERITIRTSEGEEIHVYGNFLMHEMKGWQKKAPAIPFSTYIAQKMESDPDFREEILENQIRYLTDGEREETRVRFHEGVLAQIGLDQEDSKAKKMEGGEYAFALGNEGLYMAPKEGTPKGFIKHSSFFRGGDVRSAGFVTLDGEGKIAIIRPFSGHYKPQEEEILALITFLKKNLKNEDVKKIQITLIEDGRLLLQPLTAWLANREPSQT